MGRTPGLWRRIFKPKIPGGGPAPGGGPCRFVFTNRPNAEHHMGAVQTMSEPRKLGMGVAAAVLIIGLGLLGYQFFGGRQTVSAPARSAAFFTNDDGKTFFKDDVNKMVPSDHNGKPAYRADVFQGADGKQF